jgi:hypothetical protein
LLTLLPIEYLGLRPRLLFLRVVRVSGVGRERERERGSCAQPR